jgi:hypothetical protein
METLAYNSCGFKRHSPVHEMPDCLYFPEKILTVVECNDCGLGFVNPRPKEEMRKYHPPHYYQDLPLNRPEFFQRHYIQPGLLSTLKFALDGPVKAVDHAFLYFIEMMQILRKTYGITTCVARKL